MKSINFVGKVVVITGSSRGIGRAIAMELAKKGSYIVLNGRDAERLKKTEDEIKKINSHVLSVCSDVSTAEGGQLLIDSTINSFKRLDILINNAGIAMRGNMVDLDPEVYKSVFKINVLGSVNPTIPAIKHLRESKGSLIFISSLAGIRGLPYVSAYSSSKMALRAIAESIRIEEAKNNIHVGLIYVGLTDIDHSKEVLAANGSMLSLAPRKNKKVDSPEKVARAVVKNIVARKFITVLTFLGRINYFMQPRFPLLVEKLITKNVHKFMAASK